MLLLVRGCILVATHGEYVYSGIVCRGMLYIHCGIDILSHEEQDMRAYPFGRSHEFTIPAQSKLVQILESQRKKNKQKP